MNRRAQSILEYTLLLAVIIGLVVVFVFQVLQPKTQVGYEKTASGIDNAANMTQGHGIFPNGTGGNQGVT